MKIEILVYAYLAVCLAMIAFNIVCIFLFSRNDREIESHRLYFVSLIRAQFFRDEIEESHRKMLIKRLQKVREMMSFDKSLEILSKDHPDEVREYLRKLDNVFITLNNMYSHKNEVQFAYFPYIISRYNLFMGEDLPQINACLFQLIQKPSVYSRENALNALYSIGISKNVAEALKVLDKTGFYHHKKLITDGLLTFSGDKHELNECLWDNLPQYSLNVQLAILDYFRFSSDKYQERMFKLLNEQHNCEIHYCAIRYLGRYPYQPAYDKLVYYAENEDDMHWEYASISCFALASYPGDRTVAVLKNKLCSHNWYVRLNASQSLEQLGLEYADFVDIYEGHDRYAGEMIRYRFDHKKLSEKGAASI